MKSALALLASALLIASSGIAQQVNRSPQAITWVVIDLPPFSIVEGPLAGVGITQKTVDLFKAKLPDYTHIDLQAPIGRRETLAERGENICSGSVINTPDRQARWIFSKDIFPFLPARFFVRTDIDLKGLTQISAREINRFDRIGVENHRAQGAVIDALIADIADDRKTSVPNLNTALAMFRSHRIDGFFGFAHEVTYLARDQGDLSYVSLPVRGAVPIAGGLACAKSEWGRATIDRIDHLVDEQMIRLASDFYLEWIDAQGRADYKTALADFLTAHGAAPVR
jgi:uncharacterized protein (TIGR02285 family)